MSELPQCIAINRPYLLRLGAELFSAGVKIRARMVRRTAKGGISFIIPFIVNLGWVALAGH